MLTLVLLGIGAFFVAAFGDVLWARWSHSVTNRKPKLAASYAILMGLLGWYGWNAYHVSYWLMIPTVSGYGIGTYVEVERQRTKALRDADAEAGRVGRQERDSRSL